MKRLVLTILAATLLSAPAMAQNKYDVFAGQYSASIHIATYCKGVTTYNAEGAADIAKQQEGLRRTPILRRFYYGKTAQLKQIGYNALTARGVNYRNASELCRFARSVAGKDDKIGRFLRAK